MSPARVLLVALVPEDPANFQHSLGISFLKTYADSLLGGRADIRCLHLTLDRAGASRRAVARELSSFKPQVVGFSCFVWNRAAVRALAREAAAAGARVVLGGPETYGDVPALLRESGADAAVVGEGEATFAELLDRFQAGASWEGVKGAVCRVGGKTLSAGPREPIKDLDAIPSPYLAGLFAPRAGGRWWPLETQRGCFYKCSYCATWSPMSPVRSFSLGRVARELAWLKERTTPEDWVCVVDTDSFRHRARALSLLRAFRGLPAGVYMETNLTHWDDELLKAVELGDTAIELGVGVNAIDFAVSDLAGRPRIDRALLARQLARLRQTAPKAAVRLQFMVPMPGESIGHCREKIDWAFRQDAQREFFTTVILPGTRFERDAAALGLDYLRKPPYYLRATKECSRAELRDLRWLLFLLDQCVNVKAVKSVLTWLADRFHGGSLLSAVESLYASLPAPRRKLLRSYYDPRDCNDGFILTTGRPAIPLEETLGLAWEAVGRVIWPGPATPATRRVVRRQALGRAGTRLEFSTGGRGGAAVLIGEDRESLERRHDAVLDLLSAPGLSIRLDVSRELLESEAGLIELGRLVAGLLERLHPGRAREEVDRLAAAAVAEARKPPNRGGFSRTR